MKIEKLKYLNFIIPVLLFLLIFFRMPAAYGITVTSPPISPSENLTPTPTPKGQLISVDLRMPGIGSAGGNMEPLRPERELSIYLFNSQINTEDKTAKPISIHKTNIKFDSDPSSSTYGYFINKSIYLNEETKSGKYQIVIKSDQALSKLIKVKVSDLGGQIFEIRDSYSQPIKISNIEMIVGDIHPLPKGDNIMDIHDYNALVSCFGAKAETELCADKMIADLDDNGVIDGVDYNLMFGGFKKLLEAGYPVPDFINPKLSQKPKTKISKAVSPKPTAVIKEDLSTKQKGASKGSIGVVIFVTVLFFIFLILSIIFRKKILNLLNNLIHKSDKAKNSNITQQNTVNEVNGEEAIDKDYYVKQQSNDEVNKTIVLTLTDDSGPILGYYKGGEIKEGFAHIKGVLRKDESKVYVEVYELVPIE